MLQLFLDECYWGFVVKFKFPGLLLGELCLKLKTKSKPMNCL